MKNATLMSNFRLSEIKRSNYIEAEIDDLVVFKDGHDDNNGKKFGLVNRDLSV